MPPQEFRRIRTQPRPGYPNGYSLDGLAKVLRIESLTSVHRWEKGLRPISGPVAILMELIDAGELPERYV